MVKSISKNEFNNLYTKKDDVLINKEGKDSILKFTAVWCSPCKMLAPILNKLSEKYTDMPIYEIDVDEEYGLSAMFDIKSIPTLIFVSKLGKTNKQIGALTEGQLEKFILKYFKSGE